MTSIGKEPFGSHEGKTVDLYTLTSTDGATVKISSYGGIITSWTVPDRSGKQTDIVLGFKNLASYTSPSYLATCPYFGALIGRYGNRIGGARFSLNGIEYQLAPNDGPNNLHGGPKGFDKRVWDGADEAVGDDAALTLEYVSAAGEEGSRQAFDDRRLHVQSGGVLRIDYSATTDRTTIANLTQHTYFNLAGEGNGDILGTELEINASRFTPVDANLIATGELRSVEGTPFDFRRATAIGARVNQKDQQLGYGEGYDHNFVIDRGSEMGLVLAARAYEPSAGVCSKSSRPSPASSSTWATTSTAVSSARAASRIPIAAASASRPSTIPTPRTSRGSRASRSSAARLTPRRRSSSSRRGRDVLRSATPNPGQAGPTPFGGPLTGSLPAHASDAMLAAQVGQQAAPTLRPVGTVAHAHRIRRSDEEVPLPRVKASRYRPIPSVTPKRGQA